MRVHNKRSRWLYESVWRRNRNIAVRRVKVKRRRSDLHELSPRQRTHRPLRRHAHAIRKRIVENSIRGANRPQTLACRVPHKSNARHETLVVAWCDAPRNAHISGKQKPRRRIGHHARLLAWNEGVEPVARLSVRIDDLVTHPVVDREPALRVPLVLVIESSTPVPYIPVEVTTPLVKNYRSAKQKVGKRIIGREGRGEYEEGIWRNRLKEIELIPTEF